MSSLKQIEANRANALKSTGPRTKIGKSISSRNSIRHGLLSASVLLEGESAFRFHQLIDSLIAEFQPQGECQIALVQSMAVARWRQMRLWGFERATLTEEIQRQQSEPDAAENQPSSNLKAARAFSKLGETSRALDLIQRYETSYVRMYGRCLDRLKQLRALPAQQLPSERREKPSVQPSQEVHSGSEKPE